MKICRQCGKEFERQSPRALSCSLQCTRRFNNNLPKNREAARVASRAWCRRPETKAWRGLCAAARRLGIEPGEVAALRTATTCAACRQPFGAGALKQAIDHDHKTGRIRGVLHLRCNVILGQAQDDPALLALLSRFIS